MNNNNTNKKANQQAQGQKDSSYIKLEKTLPFDGTLNGQLTTSVELARHVNMLFKGVFGDCEGSIIIPDQYGRITVSLYFRDRGAGNIVPIAVKTRGNSFDPKERIRNMNLRNRNKTYSLSDELKDIMEQFLPSSNARGGINWDRHVYEMFEQQQVYGGASNIYVNIRDLDINKILKVIYGDRSEDGGVLDYNVTMLKPIGMAGGGINQNYVLKVDQLNVKKVEELASKIGMMPSVGAIPMIRDI